MNIVTRLSSSGRPHFLAAGELSLHLLIRLQFHGDGSWTGEYHHLASYLFKKHRTGPVLFCVNEYVYVGGGPWMNQTEYMHACSCHLIPSTPPLYFMIWSSELPTASAYSVSTWQWHRNSNKGRVGMQDLATDSIKSRVWEGTKTIIAKKKRKHITWAEFSWCIRMQPISTSTCYLVWLVNLR